MWRSGIIVFAYAMGVACTGTTPPPSTRLAGGPESDQPAPETAPSGGQVTCGTEGCPAAQACCEFGPWPNPHWSCVPMVEEGMLTQNLRDEQVGKQLRACKERLVEGTGAAISFCDESSDCPAPAVCCALDFDGVAVKGCTTAKAGAEPTCDHEVCRSDGAQCSTAGTGCERGACRVRDRHVACGKDTCAAGSLCCVGPGGARCTRPDECGQAEQHLECTRPSDCPAGARCCAKNDSHCSAGCLDGDGEVYLCATDDDCKLGSPGNWRCTQMDNDSNLPPFVSACAPPP
jgi:hypothetical protein